ncbi:hypothetical protein HW555_005883 [Spodoptera exigua]|uniref:Uncharacterized protein n=1 Tax=Spodoptera exigua TaxID=7107 RepID=A0A835L703_SPOEX|nr:hypothetical protein HW555_005883 [Spodoptera exigua]
MITSSTSTLHHRSVAYTGCSALTALSLCQVLGPSRPVAKPSGNELWADRCGHIQRQEAADCSCTRLAAPIVHKKDILQLVSYSFIPMFQ